jgi:ABC-2 type transport system permease protein
MSTIIQPSKVTSFRAAGKSHAAGMPFLLQVGMMARRSLLVNVRVPAAVIPPLIISAFFLLIYQAQLGGVSQFFLHGQSYLGFILPLSVASAALSGASIAGQTIVSDIGRGYFDKLMLTPINRWALVLGPMISGAVLLVAQTITILVLGLLLGLNPATGFAGLLAVIGFSLLLGVAFSGLTVGVALLTGNAAATGSAGFLFFPLTFLTATFVPLDQLSGWIKVAAELNPITYVLGAMRALLNSGWDGALMAQGAAASVIMFGVLFGFTLYALRIRTRRR